jgi:hypothetical protein
MKTLKLEVGKTYRSRAGEEVKIVGTNDSIWPFIGDNEESYNEQGRYYSANWSSPYDLIEEVKEVPSEPTRHTFAIPDGVKKITVSQVGNRIVVDMVPEERREPKPGDVMINKYGSVYILKSIVGKVTHKYFAHLGKSGRLAIDMSCYAGRPATSEEAQPLFDALKKAGKRWNPETMQVEEIPEFGRIRELMEVIERYLKYREGEK